MNSRTTHLPESGRTAPLVRIANAVLGTFAGGADTGSFSVDRLLHSATRRAGLTDFGEGDIRTPLTVLLESMAREARLHPLGAFIARTRLLGILENRLRTAYWFSRRPEIHREQVLGPLFITGLQRTGTTLLQRLLAADPAARALASWEGLNPAPPLPASPGRHRSPDPRIREARRAQRSLQLLAPEFFIIHPVEFDGPEEEVLLLDHSFISSVPEALMYVPTFSRWVEEQDQGPAYDRLHLLLQLLQWQRPGEHWVLKSPHHLEWLDNLVARFPDARLVMTHRDPRTATNSFFSMVWHSNRLFSHSTPADRLGRHWFRKTTRMVERMMDFRRRRTDVPICDVSYYDLVADPLGQVEKIYRHFDMELTQTARRAMEATLAGHRRNRYGVHRYHPQSFGIDEEQWESAYRDYRRAFDLPQEHQE